MRLVLLLAVSGGSPVGQETFSASALLDEQVEQAVRDGLIPGAVLVVGHNGKDRPSKSLWPAGSGARARTYDRRYDL